MYQDGYTLLAVKGAEQRDQIETTVFTLLDGALQMTYLLSLKARAMQLPDPCTWRQNTIVPTQRATGPGGVFLIARALFYYGLPRMHYCGTTASFVYLLPASSKVADQVRQSPPSA